MRVEEDRSAVERLYARLADALRQSRSDAFGAPVTVAEIYQELVPYRNVRNEVGFAMNADYEHALLRLLAGQGEHARVEPASAREAIQRELKTPNPNVSIYREYAGCDVYLTPSDGESRESDWLDELADDDEHSTATGTADGWDALEALGADAEEDDVAAQATGLSVFELADDELDPAAQPPEGTPAPAAPAAPLEVPAPAAAASPTATAVRSCCYCESPLPDRRTVRYCPHCGGDQTMIPCGACGEPLEQGWRFCVACGAQGGGN